MFNDQTLWYAARSAGMISWLLLALSVVWGLLMSTKIVRGGAKRGWLLGVHRSLGGFAVIFTLIHIAALWLHGFIPFGILDFVIPFKADWKPFPTALGVISLWIILAVEITSLFKKHLPNKLWRYVHISSLGLFITAAIHGYLSGTDAHLIFFVLAIAVVSSPVGLLVIIRFSKVSDAPVNDRTAAIRARVAKPITGDAPLLFEPETSPARQINSQPTIPAPNYSPEPQSPPTPGSSPYAPPEKPVVPVAPTPVQSTQWVQSAPIITNDEAKPTNDQAPKPAELPPMTHQKISKKHRGISSLFDDIDPNDYDPQHKNQ